MRWSLVVGCLTPMKEGASQRGYSPWGLFDTRRYVSLYGIAWRAMPNEFPSWHAVHQQASLYTRMAISP
jgi:Putative transposase of IS4/5 family (DUF4096)